MYYYIISTVIRVTIGEEEVLVPRFLLLNEDSEEIARIEDPRAAFPSPGTINQAQSQLWRKPKYSITENTILGLLQHECTLVLKRMEKKGKGTIDQSWIPSKHFRPSARQTVTLSEAIDPKYRETGDECETNALGKGCLRVEPLGSRKIIGEMYLLLMEQTFNTRNALYEGIYGFAFKKELKRPPDLAAEFGLSEQKSSHCCSIS